MGTLICWLFKHVAPRQGSFMGCQSFCLALCHVRPIDLRMIWSCVSFWPCSLRPFWRFRWARSLSGGSCHQRWTWQHSSGWWFGTFFIFPYIGNNDPNWLIFFRGFQTTNQSWFGLRMVLKIGSWHLWFQRRSCDDLRIMKAVWHPDWKALAVLNELQPLKVRIWHVSSCGSSGNNPWFDSICLNRQWRQCVAGSPDLFFSEVPINWVHNHDLQRSWVCHMSQLMVTFFHDSTHELVTKEMTHFLGCFNDFHDFLMVRMPWNDAPAGWVCAPLCDEVRGSIDPPSFLGNMKGGRDYILSRQQILIFDTSSTAQGGGGSFRIGTLWERLVVVNHGWQSESTDGLKGGWSCVFWSGCNGCSGHLTHNCWM